MSERTIPADGINPYAEHPGFNASSCPLRYTVTQRSAYGSVGTCGFGCEMTGGHCVPSTYCDKRPGGRRATRSDERADRNCKERSHMSYDQQLADSERDNAALRIINADLRAELARRDAGVSQDQAAARVNGDELDNMLTDRAATIVGARDGYRSTPLYRRPALYRRPVVVSEGQAVYPWRDGLVLLRAAAKDMYNKTYAETRLWFTSTDINVRNAATAAGEVFVAVLKATEFVGNDTRTAAPAPEAPTAAQAREVAPVLYLVRKVKVWLPEVGYYGEREGPWEPLDVPSAQRRMADMNNGNGWLPGQLEFRPLVDQAIATQPKAAPVAEAPTRSDQQIVQQTETLAAALAQYDGYKSTVPYMGSQNPRAIKYWKMACIAQEVLTATDPMDAACELEDVATPATEQAKAETNDWKAQHLRQFMHNDGSGFVFAYDKAGIDQMLAAAQASPAKPDLSGLIDLLNEIKPNYGAVGSRDVDVTAQRKRIEDAISLLAAITREQK